MTSITSTAAWTRLEKLHAEKNLSLRELFAAEANRADTYSAEAARAASIAVGPVPTGGSADAALAVTAARGYLEQAGAVGTVNVLGPGVVEVSVTVTASTPMLGIAVSQTRTHTAQLLVGVTQGKGLS